MSDSNEKERLRALLDERGVEWRETMSGGTAWLCNNGDEAVTLREDAGLQQLRAWVTPEQAVEATLGSDTKECENLLWELVGALDIADATDASKKPIVTEYARRIAARCRGGR